MMMTMMMMTMDSGHVF